MSKQLYYIAIVCPPAVNEEILVFKHWMRDQFNCKAALKSPAHITLIPSFLMEKRLEDDLAETALFATQDLCVKLSTSEMSRLSTIKSLLQAGTARLRSRRSPKARDIASLPHWRRNITTAGAG